MPANAVSLPAEILCMIFFYAVETEDTYSRGNGRLGWVSSVTHTCQKWRRVALECPALWAENICYLRSNQATDCFLARAQAVPLKLRTRYGAYDHNLSNRLLKLAKKHLPRLQTIDIRVPLRFVFNLTGRKLPGLTTLRLHCSDSDSVAAHNLLASKTWVTPNAPALRELTLHHAYLTVAAPNLRILHVEKENSAGSLAAFTQSSLLDMLRTTPLLEELTLNGSFDERRRQDTDSNSSIIPVNMRHLRRMELQSRCPGSLLSFLCRSLRFPGDIDITIDQVLCDPAVSLVALFSNLQIHRSPAYDTLIARNFTWNINAIWRSSVLAERYNNIAEEPMLRLSAAGSDYQNQSSIEAVTQKLPLATREDIRFLDFGNTLHASEINQAGMRAVLAPFTNVEAVFLSVHPRKLHIMALCEKDLVEDWSNEEGDEEKEEAKPDCLRTGIKCALPALRHLVVNELSDPQGQQLLRPVLDSSWRAIIHVLKERRRTGSPIRSLTLSGAYRFPEPKFGANAQVVRAIFEACDDAYLLRARKLVDKLVDARGDNRVNGSQTKTVLEYDMQMQALSE